MPEINPGFAMTLPPEKAIAYFESKSLVPSMGWKDLQDEAHAVQFTVAGIAKLDILNDIHGGLTRALANGTTLGQFQDELEPLLQRKGWLGRGLVADEDGVMQGKKLMPYRFDTIFRTNIQSAYAAGRYQRLVANVDKRPYWQYNAIMDGRTRPAHAAMHGRIFRWDDPIWAVLYPPNGYNCRCFIRALTQEQVDAHPVGVESSESYLVTVQQPYGTNGELRPVTGFKDPKSGHVMVADAGFNLNPGRSYLAGLGRNLLEKGISASPELVSVAVKEALTNNRLSTAMNRDVHEWLTTLNGDSQGDFRRVGALSPRALSGLKNGQPLLPPVISLTAEAYEICRDAGNGLWPRLVSVLHHPQAVLVRDDALLIIVDEASPRRVITLSRNGSGYYISSVQLWSEALLTGAELLDGTIPEV